MNGEDAGRYGKFGRISVFISIFLFVLVGGLATCNRKDSVPLFLPVPDLADLYDKLSSITRRKPPDPNQLFEIIKMNLDIYDYLAEDNYRPLRIPEHPQPVNPTSRRKTEKYYPPSNK